MIFLQLFVEFFRTGLLAVGGGLATLPFLRDISVRRGWFTLAELTDMIAVAESTPGPIGVNTATYAGYKVAGIPGALTATFALILPAFLIMLAVVTVLKRFRENRFVIAVLDVLRPTSVALVASAVASVVIGVLINKQAIAEREYSHAVFFFALILYVVLTLFRRSFPKAHPLILIVLGAAAGLLVQL